MGPRSYKGHGFESPIRCILISGWNFYGRPSIVCQFPDPYIPRNVFKTFSANLFPQRNSPDKKVTFNAQSYKVVGYNISIHSRQYPEDIFMFNVCFLCDKYSQTDQYEPVVKKLAEHLGFLEKESAFLSRGSRSEQSQLICHLLFELNAYRKTTITKGNFLHLKVKEIQNDPSTIKDHDVPVLLQEMDDTCLDLTLPEFSSNDPEDCLPITAYTMSIWDSITLKLISLIDGCTHVSKIAVKANTEKTLVKACIRNLVYHKMVKLLPLRKCSDMYYVTSKFERGFGAYSHLQQACCSYVRIEGQCKPSYEQTLEVFSLLHYGNKDKAVNSRFDNICRNYNFDVKKLILFSLVNELTCCVRRYQTVSYKVPQPKEYTAVELSGRKKLLMGAQIGDIFRRRNTMEIPALSQIIEE